MPAAPSPFDQPDKSQWPLDLHAITDELDTGLIVPDTNIWLDLHRIRDEGVRKTWFDLFTDLGERLWIPQQVAHEYRENLGTARERHRDQVANEIESLNRKFDSISLDFRQYSRNSHINNEEGTHAALTSLNLSRNTMAEVLGSVAACDALAPEELDEIVKAAVFKLLGNKIGPEPTEKDLKQWRIESVERLDKRLPPSWADRHKGSTDELHGDYIIWKQLLQRCCSDEHQRHRMPIVFVTKDRKATGWMEHRESMPIGAHHLLVEEMQREAGVVFVVMGPHHLRQYDLDRTVVAMAEDTVWGVEPAEDALDPLKSFLITDTEDDFK